MTDTVDIVITDFGPVRVIPAVGEMLREKPKGKGMKRKKDRQIAILSGICRLHALAYELGVESPAELFVQPAKRKSRRTE